MTSPAPPGWPATVAPPGTAAFERTALGWLYDQTPPELRGYPVVGRHPVALARLAVATQQAAESALRSGLRTLRAELGEMLGPEALAELLEVYAREAERAAASARGAALLEQALTGRRWVPRL